MSTISTAFTSAAMVSTATTSCVPSKQALLVEGSGGQGFVPLFTAPAMSLYTLTNRSRKVTRVVIEAQPFSYETYTEERRRPAACEFLTYHTVAEAQPVVDEETLVIAPWFPTEEQNDTSEDWSDDIPADLPSLWWKGSYWDPPYGDTWALLGHDDEEIGLSAYAVFDKLVTDLQEDVSGAFPNLKSISIFGFSGGAKMVHRWSVLSDVLVPGAGRAKVSAAFGGADSFLYFDDKRPADVCRPLSSEQVATCPGFGVPEDVENCTRYDHWPYGFAYVAHKGYPYVRSRILDPELLKKTLLALPNKSILAMVGDKDWCSCYNDGYYDEGFVNDASCYVPPPDVCSDTYPDTPWGMSVGVVGGSCTKSFEGRNRRQRLNNWVQYVSHYFLREFRVTYQPTFSLFPGMHDVRHFWRSPEFQSVVFGIQA